MNYQSLETWQQATDYLRCNPLFYGQPRYDLVMVNMFGDDSTFCRLVRVFTYAYAAQTYALALVQPYTTFIQSSQSVDRKLGLCRIHEKPRHESQIIPMRSIIRGALCIQDNEKEGDFLVLDTIDEDMFLRLVEIFPDRDMAT